MDEKNSQTLPLHGREAPLNPSSSTIKQQYAWLATYFALNLTLTLYNKAVMGKVGWLRLRGRGRPVVLGLDIECAAANSGPDYSSLSHIY